MKRHHLIELEDQPWFPAVIRDGATDWLRFMADRTRAFDAIAPLIRRAMQATNTTRVIDLCSGGGGPWVTLERTLAASGPAQVELSDLYPNLSAQAQARQQSDGRVGGIATPVDATDVPAERDGVRTMFNCFHHFDEPMARDILADAVRKRRAIAVFEGFDHRALGLLAVWAQVPLVFLLTPLLRPLSLARLALTYLVPAIPGLVFFDGTMSMFRLYMPDELRELVATVPGHESFDWDIGTTRSVAGPLLSLTHLVGTPKP